MAIRDLIEQIAAGGDDATMLLRLMMMDDACVLLRVPRYSWTCGYINSVEAWDARLTTSLRFRISQSRV
jgi:hypothetical protein